MVSFSIVTTNCNGGERLWHITAKRRTSHWVPSGELDWVSKTVPCIRQPPFKVAYLGIPHTSSCKWTIVLFLFFKCLVGCNWDKRLKHSSCVNTTVLDSRVVLTALEPISPRQSNALESLPIQPLTWIKKSKLLYWYLKISSLSCF